MNILLIEPDRVLARTYASFLRQQGHAVSLATDAQTAVHALDSQEPEVILLELQMARHNGLEFLYELRSYSDWQHIPVIAHTMLPPNSMQMSSQFLTALGVIAYLYKPVTSLVGLKRALAEVVQPVGS